MTSQYLDPSEGDSAALAVSDRYLVIRVDEDRYGLPLDQVREVLRAVWISPLPDSPAVVGGIIDVRGRFVPVIDMRRRFGRVSPQVAPSERFVLAWSGQREVAIRADSVEWFTNILTTSREEVTDVIRRDSIVSGLAHTPDGLVLIQDLDAFLTEAESASLETAIISFNAAGAGVA